MSDHEFEKRVRQELNQFKMTPSVKAWENIEDGLRNRRRRNVPFLWLPVLMLGLATGGYFLYHSSRKPVGHAAELLAKKDGVKRPDKGNIQPGSNASVQTERVRGKEMSLTPSVHHIKSPASQSKGKVIPLFEEGSRKVIFNQRHNKSTIHFVSANKNQNRPVKSNYLQSPTTESPDDLSQTERIARSSVSFTHPGTPAYNSPGQSNNILQRLAGFPDIKNAVNTASVTAAKKTEIKKVSKWSFGVNAYTGIVAVNNGNILDFDNNKVEDVSGTSTAMIGAFGRSYTPSKISPGLAFSFGGFVKRELSKRFSVSAGLNYAQFNTQSLVGQRINSTQVVNNGPAGYLYVQSYYLLDEVQSAVYKNKYEFVELPVNAYYRLNSNVKFPVYLNGGFVLSRLIHSNSLHFDGSSGVYYKNDRLLNQTQAGASAGVSFSLFNKSSTPFWIGPSARSNISQILKRDFSTSKHFMTIGLDMKLFFR